MPVRAARLVDHGQPLLVEDVDLVQPSEGEALVDMLYAGVNPIDRYNALGRVNKDLPLPRTMGLEGVGSCAGRTVLIHGYGVGTSRDGVWSTQAVVPTDALIDVPEDVSPQDAAVMGIAGVTAWRTVTEYARVTASDRVLVLGAGGGVGSIVVAIAHAIGAEVWGQSATASKEEWIRQLGADHVVTGDAHALPAALAEHAPTVTIDPLGGAFTGAAISSMANHGRLVIFGTSADASGAVPLQDLYRKGLTIYGYAGLQTPDDIMAKSIAEALAALSDGRLRATVDSVLELDDVNTAFERLSDRSVRGNLVLHVSA
jgi:NADPH2:quinone reductase